MENSTPGGKGGDSFQMKPEISEGEGVHPSPDHPFFHSPIHSFTSSRSECLHVPGTCHCVVTPRVSKVKSEKKVKSLSRV